MVSCKLSYYFSSPVCLGLVGLVLARRANKMVIKSTTSCKIAPQNAGIIPVKAINSIKMCYFHCVLRDSNSIINFRNVVNHNNSIRTFTSCSCSFSTHSDPNISSH